MGPKRFAENSPYAGRASLRYLDKNALVLVGDHLVSLVALLTSQGKLHLAYPVFVSKAVAV
jgi:hypothetical protein